MLFRGNLGTMSNQAPPSTVARAREKESERERERRGERQKRRRLDGVGLLLAL